MFDKIVGLQGGLSDTAQEMITQDELDASAPSMALIPLNSIMGAKIGWRDFVEGEEGSEKGRGVFAMQDIPKGTKIEVAPVIVVAADDVPDSGGAPDGYLLDWEPETKGEEHCMPLGYIMLYNHSRAPTLELENDHATMTITSFALRDIKAGEELTWDYSCEIWFDEE